MGARRARVARDAGWTVGAYDQAGRTQPYVARDFATEEEAWAWHPDAVFICTPVSQHARLLWRSVPRPTLVEKPLALCAADVSLAGHAGAPADMEAWLSQTDYDRVVVGNNWRFHPLVRELRRLRADHPATTHGPVLHSVFWCYDDMRTWPGHDYADILLEAGAHEVDLVRHLCGPQDLVSTTRPTPSSWRLRLRHAGGESIVVLDGASAPLRGCRIDCGSYLGGYDVHIDDPRDMQALDESYRLETEHFLACASGQAQPDTGTPATLADGLGVLRILDAARAMAQ